MSDELTQKVISIISEVRHIPSEKITIDSTFDDLGVDSLAGMGIIYDLESEYKIEIPNEDVFAIRDVRGMVTKLREVLAQQGEKRIEETL